MPQLTDKEIFERFLKEMETRRWTVKEATDALNVSEATFFLWKKKGKISPRGRAAMAIFLRDVDDHSINIDAPHNNGTIINHGAPEDFSAAIRKILASPELTAEEKNKVVKVLVG